MHDIDPQLEALDRQLAELDEGSMTLSELDGFVAGLLVGPELILPSEWLPLVWGPGEDGDGPVFASPDEARSLSEAVLSHYNAVADDLARGRHAPIYDIDRDDTALWEIWIGGFERAVGLRADAWVAAMDPEAPEGSPAGEAFSAFNMMAALMLAADDQDTEQSEEDRAAMCAAAPELIPQSVEALYVGRVRREAAARGPRSTGPKAGRNDPCPCGSGKKFKKCCGVAG